VDRFNYAVAWVVRRFTELFRKTHTGEGKPLAKRGKLSGSKQVWRCNTCGYREITLFNVTTKTCPKCGSAMEALLKPVIKDGKVVVKLPKVKEIREYVKKQLESVEI
ncbi:MAG: hypothetical protein ABGF52_13145, partial [Candidatus Asgardarchaeum sp.]